MQSEPMTAPPPMYAVLYPPLLEIARKHGYALSVHGTMARDFDLIAVPWTAEAGEPTAMVNEMRVAVQGVYTHHEFDYLLTDSHITKKPHGRLSWSIHLTNKGAYGPYIDLCVMPRVLIDLPAPPILKARKILGRLCEHGLLSMSIPVRLDEDEDMVLRQVIDCAESAARPALTVWFDSMPESNGKRNWTVILHRVGDGLEDGITIERTEYYDRARYEYDRMRWLIGEVQDRPDITKYDERLKEPLAQDGA